MIVADVLMHQALQVAFIHSDYMEKEFAATIVDPTLRNAISPRTVVCLDWMPNLFIVSMTSALKVDPRPRIKLLGAESLGNASSNC